VVAITPARKLMLLEDLTAVRNQLDDDRLMEVLDTLWKYRRDENMWAVVRAFTKPSRTESK
jgi:hypothetical protein